MDFRLNEDQLALRDGIRSFCEGRVPIDGLRSLEDVQDFDRERWQEWAEMGVFQLRLSEAEGGLGLGVADAVVVFAELGRALAPGPLVWSHLAAGQLEGAADGKVVVGGLDDALGGSGPHLIEHFACLDALLVLRHTGVYCVDPRQVEATPVEVPLDPLTPLHQAPELPEGECIDGPEEAARVRMLGTVVVAAQLLGIAESSLEQALAYAKKREQFNRPIGSFQAMKHLLADMFVRQEVARAAVYAAGATLDAPDVGDPARAVSAAKITAGEAALRNSRASIQVQGGMGYTWEVPAHYYLKRTWVLENTFGTVDDHADHLGELAGGNA